MGASERRARERIQQRQRIIDAALAMIAQDGFAALSMRKLADQIEYSAASIYLHFQSRDQLAQELRHVGFEQLLTKLEAAVGNLIGPEALYAIGAAYVAFGTEQPQLYRVMFMGEPRDMQAAYAGAEADVIPDRAYEVLLRITQTLSGVSKQKATPMEIAAVIWSCLHGMVSFHLALPGLQVTQLAVQENLSLKLLAAGLEQSADSST